MKTLGILAVACILFTGCCTTGPRACGEKAAAGPERVLRHIVLLKFRDTTTPERIQAISDHFLALKQEINTVLAIEGGRDTSPENLQQGFTHGFVVTFADEAGREVYLPHPAHKAFVEFMKADLDGVLVVDYWSRP